MVLYRLSPFFRILADIEPQQFLLNKAIKVGMGIMFVTALSWFISTYDAFLVARYTRRLRA